MKTRSDRFVCFVISRYFRVAILGVISGRNGRPGGQRFAFRARMEKLPQVAGA